MSSTGRKHSTKPARRQLLSHAAALCATTERMQDAEELCQEALSIRRRLAEQHPEVYLPDLAMATHHLALLYFETQRSQKAMELCREAERLLRPLWRASPALYGNQMARILGLGADLHGEAGQAMDGCTLACEALAMAYDPNLKAQIQSTIARWCQGAGNRKASG